MHSYSCRTPCADLSPWTGHLDNSCSGAYLHVPYRACVFVMSCQAGAVHLGCVGCRPEKAGHVGFVRQSTFFEERDWGGWLVGGKLGSNIGLALASGCATGGPLHKCSRHRFSGCSVGHTCLDGCSDAVSHFLAPRSLRVTGEGSLDPGSHATAVGLHSHLPRRPLRASVMGPSLAREREREMARERRERQREKERGSLAEVVGIVRKLVLLG